MLFVLTMLPSFLLAIIFALNSQMNKLKYAWLVLVVFPFVIIFCTLNILLPAPAATADAPATVFLYIVIGFPTSAISLTIYLLMTASKRKKQAEK